MTHHNKCPKWALIAWVMGRREQYEPSSASYDALSLIIGGLARGEYVAAWEHGELDDLRNEARRMRVQAGPKPSSLTAISRAIGGHRNLVRKRLTCGWTLERATTEPPRRQRTYAERKRSVCAITGCNGLVIAKGYCRVCYARARRKRAKGAA